MTLVIVVVERSSSIAALVANWSTIVEQLWVLPF